MRRHEREAPERVVPTSTAARRRGLRRPLATLAFLTVAGLVSAAALAGPVPADLDGETTATTGAPSGSQQLRAPDDVELAAVTRDTVDASSLQEALANGGTNYDWAKLVLRLAKLPATDGNVTVFTRWMRQENGPQDWWNRNNPLNNGWGSGGNSGLGSYVSLISAAAFCAEALHSVPGYTGIVAAFAASAPAEQIERAIWASPWASSHYGNGTHWSHAPVPVVTAPPGAWR